MVTLVCRGAAGFRSGLAEWQAWRGSVRWGVGVRGVVLGTGAGAVGASGLGTGVGAGCVRKRRRV